MHNRITVIALDDHSLILDGVASYLGHSSDIELVGKGGSGEELEALMRVHRPHVAVVNLGMPQQLGGIPDEGPHFRALPATGSRSIPMATTAEVLGRLRYGRRSANSGA